MAHSVSCGVCNATFSIPDEVWEKRVEGQLATLKCRHCKAPIQIDGRTKRNANSLVESRAVVDPKTAATPSQKEVSAPAADTDNTIAATQRGEDGPITREQAKNAAAESPGVSQEHTNVPVEEAKSQPAVAAPRARMNSAEVAVTNRTSAEKAAKNVLARTASHPDISAKMAEERPTKLHEDLTKEAPVRGSSMESKPRAEPARESSDATLRKEPIAHPATAKRAMPGAKFTTAAESTGAKGQHPPATKLHTPAADTVMPAEQQRSETEGIDTAAVVAQRRTPAIASSSEQHHAQAEKLDGAATKPVTPVTVASPSLEQQHPQAKRGDTRATDKDTDTRQQGAVAQHTEQGLKPAAAKPGPNPRGGGPPPLRKSAASTPEIQGGAPQLQPRSPEPGSPEKHGPPPLPRQPSVHDAEARQAEPRESHENAPRVHSPASMPVVAAMAVPFSGSRTSSLAPRPSDIAALVKIRPKFPKWLPFAVLGAAVLLVSGLAALSWLRGDISVEKSSITGSSAVMPYPDSTMSASATRTSGSSAAVDAPASDSRSSAAEFASQFAQAAAKQHASRFDRDVAVKALAPAFVKAASCHNRGEPVGAARVTISIAPSGQILSVTLAPPFAGTYTAECIRNALAEARSEPFQGAPGRLVHSISIR